QGLRPLRALYRPVPHRLDLHWYPSSCFSHSLISTIGEKKTDLLRLLSSRLCTILFAHSVFSLPAEEGNPDQLYGLINFQKHILVSRVIEGISLSLSLSVPFSRSGFQFSPCRLPRLRF